MFLAVRGKHIRWFEREKSKGFVEATQRLSR